MAIVKMKKLRAIVLRDQRENLTQELMRLGCVQITAPELAEDEPTFSRLCPERTDLPLWKTKQNTVMAALRILDGYSPEKKTLLSARPEVTEQTFLHGRNYEQSEAAAEQICQWDSEIRRLASEQVRIRNEIESLKPWEALDVPLDGTETKTCAVGLVSSVVQIEERTILETAESVTDTVEVLTVSEDDVQRCYMIVSLRENLSAVMDALRSIGCTQVSFSGIRGTAAENIRWLESELDRIGGEIGGLQEALVSQGEMRRELQTTADHIAAEIARREAIEQMPGMASVVLLEGWCPAEKREDLTVLLDRFDCAYEFFDPAPEEYENVPVALKNARAVEPMNLVTEMYSLPAYDGVDPNPYMWPFFILFYGIMMADMGYGILMMLASVIALKKMKPKGGTGYLLKLLGMCGVSTFLFGALTGGFFGDLIPQAAALVNPATTLKELPSLFTPLNNTVMILVGSLALGVVQIFTGMIISVVHKCKNGEGLSALFDEGAWWCILIGAVLLILKVTPILLILGGVLLVVGQFYEKKSLVGGLTGLFGAIYNGVTGYFSDILSYSRLMALMLAGSVIAMVFNTLGAMTGNVIAFIIIAMIGNALNFALNLLGCFVHDLRLQVLEFFNRFYKDGGKPYKPLNIDPKYIDIVKEEI